MVTIFLDFDDTLSDQFQFNLQYVRAIGDVLAPRYGGEVEDWAKSAIDMLETLESDYVARFYRKPLAGYSAWLQTIRARSVELLFGGMGLPVPANPTELALETQARALSTCDAAYPGVREALAALAKTDYRLHIASGQESAYLQAALQGAGLKPYTERTFGPDLIDCAKEGPEYYERIFADTGVRAKDALVIDDYPEAIRWAMQTGATVIQCQLSQERHFDVVPGVAAVLKDWRDLPKIVEGVVGSQ